MEDCSRTNNNLAFNIFNQAIDFGADRICLADTLGVLEPKEVDTIIRNLVKQCKNIPIEVHFHNDRGLAMANTLQAIDASASWISSSVNGIGERAGITDTCLLLANLHYKGLHTIKNHIDIKSISDFVANITGFSVDEHRPVIGKKAFAHVANLHVKAMDKNSSSYNWINPNILGQATLLVNQTEN